MALPSFSGLFRYGFFIFLVFTTCQCRHEKPVAAVQPPPEEEFYAGHSLPDNTYHAFYHQYLKGHFPGHLFWFALYKSSAPDELTAFVSGKNTGDPKVVCWQFTNSGKIPGIEGEVDTSFLPGRFEGEILMK